MHPIWGWVAIASFVYQVVDLYPATKSAQAMVRTFSFWLLWVVFSVINIIALAVIQVAAGKNIEQMVGGDPLTSQVVVVVLSVLATYTIIQSFTLKIADIKFVDVNAVLDGLKQTVVAQILDQVIALNTAEQQKLSTRIQSKFKNDLPGLKNEFLNTMDSVYRGDIAKIVQELHDMETQAVAAGLSFANILALRIAKADRSRAKILAK
jgi:hypothetical protein